MLARIRDELIQSVTESLAAGLTRKNDRIIGFVIAVVSGLLCLKFRTQMSVLSVIIALEILILVFRPIFYRPFTVICFSFGGISHFLMTPLILGAFFFLFLTPYGLIRRLFKKKVLSADTYWIVRTPAGPAPEDLRNLF